MTNNQYIELQDAAQDNMDKRDLARQELGEYLAEVTPPWVTTGEPETWELLPV